MRSIKKYFTLYLGCFLLLGIFNFATCKYSFKDISPIPAEVKTFRVNYFENKAQYVNTQLSPQLTERLKQKIIGTTRLTQTNESDAHYDISGYVSQYYQTTVALNGATPSANRLTVVFHVIFKNTLNEKQNFESDITTTVDYLATQSLNEVELSKNEEIVRNIVDAVFNKIFSNW